ncbi:hypothetical protein FB567DRAFT_597292 [Paraphoma chrysanthemicola]|uniref:Uncharacterized protein n=1 Tax=Paraphoma chrysanthemicola TaxID=798071 RepID=A0A8K0QVM3_9PLEO|nr:hypothetical protein FB567DRAFT_597292 [Paraphoma chrysanthemicola]
MSNHIKRRRRNSEPGQKVLPITFMDACQMEVLARYDTGTFENHILLEVAASMGYEVDDSVRKSFQLPNGNIVHAIGQMTAQIIFSGGEAKHWTEPTALRFNVFRNLAAPVLVGMSFLIATETLSKHRYRLKLVTEKSLGPHRVFSAGTATNQVCCMIDGRLVYAHADTGSEIALIDSRYVDRHGLDKLPGREKIMFADGSIGYTEGCVDVLITLPVREEPAESIASTGRSLDVPDARPREEVHVREPWQNVRFHILKNCTFNVIFSEDLVGDYQIFRNSSSSLELYTPDSIASIAPIIHLGAVEKAITHAKQRVQTMTHSSKPSKSKLTSHPDQIAQQTQDSTKQMKLEILAKMAQLDQEENRQRFWASNQSFDVGAAAKEQVRQTRYEELRNKLEDEYLRLSSNAVASPDQTLP